uniref:Uncharacterized protein n=1 Tax=Arundo donax TaxID=35708 RepID=A0A0A9B8C8_ARUDO
MDDRRRKRRRRGENGEENVCDSEALPVSIPTEQAPAGR